MAKLDSNQRAELAEILNDIDDEDVIAEKISGLIARRDELIGLATGVQQPVTEGDEIYELLTTISVWEEEYRRINNLGGSPEWVGRLDRALAARHVPVGTGWISIHESLPDIDEYVLWINTEGNSFVAEIDKDDYSFSDPRSPFHEATHWMRIPAYAK